MNRTYSLFVTDDTLLASPYVRRFNYLHDLTLHLGRSENVNFLLQEPLTTQQQKRLQVSYDSASMELRSVTVVAFERQTLVTLRIIPKELGTIRVGFTYPEARPKRAKGWLTGRNRLRPAPVLHPRPLS